MTKVLSARNRPCSSDVDHYCNGTGQNMLTIPCVHVAAGEQVTENSVGLRLSMLTLPMPIPAIQGIIDKNACHAALVSGEVRLGDLHGIILQVVASSRHLPCCEPICSSAITAGLLQRAGTRSRLETTSARLWLVPCRSAQQIMLHPIGTSRIVMKWRQAWVWAGQCSCPMRLCLQQLHFPSSTPQASNFTHDQVSGFD